MCLPCVSGIDVGSLVIKILLFLGFFGVSGTDVFGLCTSAVTLILYSSQQKLLSHLSLFGIRHVSKLFCISYFFFKISKFCLRNVVQGSSPAEKSHDD